MTSLFAFLYLAFTGILLYIIPPGRIAYWSDWHILGLNKDNLGQTHITVSMLFLIMMVLHIWLNWKSIMLYMKNKQGKLVVFTAETAAALALSCLVFFGTLAYIAPFSTINDYLSDYKDDYEYTVGIPPYPHAELSTLPDFMYKVRIDEKMAYALLDEKGIKYNSEHSLKVIAADNGMKPSDLYAIIKPAKINKKMDVVVEEEDGKDGVKAESEGKNGIDMTKYESLMGSGMGNKSIADAAEMVGISTDEALARLSKNGIKADARDTLKEVAGTAAMTPMDVYIVIDAGVKP
ncbi:MAG: DUF4405 domain-containing protein [Deferribacterales bacterium]